MTDLKDKIKIGLAGIVLVGSLNGCKEYDVDGNRIIKGDYVSWELKEIKPSGEEIFYFNNHVKITNGFFGCREIYYSSSSNVFLEAQKRMKYLNHKIDSIENVKELNDLKLLKK